MFRLKADILKELCDEYVAFGRFLVLRSSQRRAYLLRILDDMQTISDLKLKNEN